MPVRDVLHVRGVRRRLKSLLKNAVFQALPRSRLAQRGSSRGRHVALTFDDGPDHLTRAYLDRLDELDVRATFFVVGSACEKEPELMREYVRRGHQVASHGYDHTRFTKLRRMALDEQLRRTRDLLGPLASLGPMQASRPWVRPPYGDMNARVLAQLLANDNFIAMWSLDSHDYEIEDPAEVAARCSPQHVSAGEVILLHEGQQWTLDALPRIVAGLREAGFELVTMAEMFASPRRA